MESGGTFNLITSGARIQYAIEHDGLKLSNFVSEPINKTTTVDLWNQKYGTVSNAVMKGFGNKKSDAKIPSE